ncbi:glycosyltransferase family protein [Alphaproteobacteria bacterium]|nr:glycosyltransferase family protein [Alphaproteobacteria bacterium]
MIAPLIIIQARMASNRLPGKVMLPLFECKVIDLLIERLNRIEDTKVIVATTDQRTDDEFGEYLKSKKVAVIRGSEDDVLGRFGKCLSSHPVSEIIRVTADCPFIDPIIIQNLIDHYFNTGADYAYLSPKFAEGLDAEIFSASALNRACLNAKLFSEREHVTLHFSNNPELFKIAMLDQDQDHSLFRFTLDTEKDYAVLKKISAFFRYRCKEVSPDEIIQYLTDHPEILNLNSGIIRNEGLKISLEKEQQIEKGG